MRRRPGSCFRRRTTPPVPPSPRRRISASISTICRTRPAAPDPAQTIPPPSLEAVFDVPVKVQAVLGRARMPIAELVSMRPGYVFELDRRVGEAIDILVNDRLIARGEVVMIDGALGVTLTEIVRQDG